MIKSRTTLWIGLLGVALASSASAQQSQTWAVVVGVSQFFNLPANQQLEFAAKDAEAFATFLTSPRGGGVPKENVTLLLNKEATAGRLKRTLGASLPRNAGPNDVVYIFLATHGMVEPSGAKLPYVLSSDAHPDDLFTTALSMKELDQIIFNRLQKAGRIVLLADLAHSASMGSGVHTSLLQVAGKRRELIGLLATRGTETSQAGPQFCGGHGAFTCSLLKGLDGAADTDKDNIVTVAELVDFVGEQLRKATDYKQHLQNFGAFDNEVPLSFPAKPGPSDWKAFAPGPK